MATSKKSLQLKFLSKLSGDYKNVQNQSGSLDLLTQVLKSLAQEYIVCNSRLVTLMTCQLGNPLI